MEIPWRCVDRFKINNISGGSVKLAALSTVPWYLVPYSNIGNKHDKLRRVHTFWVPTHSAMPKKVRKRAANATLYKIIINANVTIINFRTVPGIIGRVRRRQTGVLIFFQNSILHTLRMNDVAGFHFLSVGLAVLTKLLTFDTHIEPECVNMQHFWRSPCTVTTICINYQKICSCDLKHCSQI